MQHHVTHLERELLNISKVRIILGSPNIPNPHRYLVFNIKKIHPLSHSCYPQCCSVISPFYIFVHSQYPDDLLLVNIQTRSTLRCKTIYIHIYILVAGLLGKSANVKPIQSFSASEFQSLLISSIVWSQSYVLLSPTYIHHGFRSV